MIIFINIATKGDVFTLVVMYAFSVVKQYMYVLNALMRDLPLNCSTIHARVFSAILSLTHK